jgi:DHA1 family bicyclomycin/chloramphenicol resistance-like MFS transporter
MTNELTSRSRQQNLIIILILGALTSVSPFSIDMYLPAFSMIASDFQTTPARISLSVTSYFIGIALGQLLYGPLLDRFGRKKPLYVGLVLYIITCIGCMLSQTIEALIVFRFIQALGGCVAMVAAMTMVRDFFPVEESLNIFSLLILILGVSPLLAPTAGGYITVWFGWQAVFIVLAVLVLVILIIAFLFLPAGRKPDPTISLKAKPMILTFAGILKEPQFYTYSLAGALSFATLFIYVAGSPVIFMQRFHVSPEVYGGLFALLSVGFIGGSQLNRLLSRKYSSQTIFRSALIGQVITAAIFLTGSYYNWFGLVSTLIIFFIILACIGILNPNAQALALAPFTKNVGSASALIGFIQLGIAGLASAGVGLFNTSDSVPIVALLAGLSFLSLLVLLIGQRHIINQVISNAAAQDGVLH